MIDPMPESESLSLAPSLLLSMPQLADPNFTRTVVLLCQHDANGAFGLVLNRPVTMTARIVPQGRPEAATERDVELPTLVPLFLAILGFTLAVAALVVFQALRFSHRIAGPAYRLVKSLERIRSGDISFRVNLRRGDHLSEVAAELNNLLDWLNENPPPGVKTGSDLVRVGRRSAPTAVDRESTAPAVVGVEP